MNYEYFHSIDHFVFVNLYNEETMKKLCPECKGNIHEYDDTRDETSCRQCGLVLTGPAVHGIVYPSFIVFPRRGEWRVSVFSQFLKIKLVVSYSFSMKQA